MYFNHIDWCENESYTFNGVTTADEDSQSLAVADAEHAFTPVSASDCEVISHGTNDKTVPVEMGQRLIAAANQPKLFYEIADGAHNDAMPQEYEELLKEFFDSFGAVQPINTSVRR